MSAGLLACPACRAPVERAEPVIACPRCGTRHPVVDGVPDFSLGERFDDVLEPDRFANEELAGEHVARSYLLPLLARLFAGRAPGTVRVLSIGCGVGREIEILLEHGFDGFGIDCGSRAHYWSRRGFADRFFLASARRLPFADASFDFAFLGCVFPHVGTVGDTYETTPDHRALRADVAREAVRVVHPGGWVLASSPNRLCPLDFFHRLPERGHTPRVHARSEPFLLSLTDYRELFVADAGCRGVETLPVADYWGFFSSSHSRLASLAQFPIRMLFRALSFRAAAPLRGTWLNPWLVVLARK